MLVLFTVAVFALTFLLLAVTILKGKYSMIPSLKNAKAEKLALYDLPKMCKFMGSLYLICAALLVVYFIGTYFTIPVLTTGSIIAFIIVFIGGTIFANSAKYFRK